MLYGVHESTISRALSGAHWALSDEQLASRNVRPAAKLSPEKVAEIRRLSNTVNHRELAAMFKVHRGTIWKITTGRTWRDL
jgi:hypothetical protein